MASSDETKFPVKVKLRAVNEVAYFTQEGELRIVESTAMRECCIAVHKLKKFSLDEYARAERLKTQLEDSLQATARAESQRDYYQFESERSQVTNRNQFFFFLIAMFVGIFASQLAIYVTAP